jgi:iron complex transport system ATP-binding protein
MKAETLTLSRGGRVVLREVSFALRPGEVVALIGANGAGKSTLIAALTGELQPDAGRVTLEGRALADWPAAALARRRAVLPQQSRLAFGFTVEEVVTLGRSPHAGLPSMRDDGRAVRAALEAAGVTRFARRDYRRLSGGEQQRVQLARCLAQIASLEADAARVLLLDEPVASLDLAFQQSVLRAARREAAQGCAVLASLHDPNLAAMHADRVLALGEGRLLADGTPDAVLTPNLLERLYGLPLLRLPHPVTGVPVLLPA